LIKGVLGDKLEDKVKIKIRKDPQSPKSKLSCELSQSKIL